MDLISSAFYSILFNGMPSYTFTPSRGIRQGDPLSPFLFILMSEGLGRMIKKTLLSSSLHGILIHGAPYNVYQQFVDDNLLFGHHLVWEGHTLKSIMNIFSKALGTSINMDKFQIFFYNTIIVIQHNISQILNILVATLPLKYLGAPLFD